MLGQDLTNCSFKQRTCGNCACHGEQNSYSLGGKCTLDGILTSNHRFATLYEPLVCSWKPREPVCGGRCCGGSCCADTGTEPKKEQKLLLPVCWTDPLDIPSWCSTLKGAKEKAETALKAQEVPSEK